jgi:hypothetical protein
MTSRSPLDAARPKLALAAARPLRLRQVSTTRRRWPSCG